MEQPPVRHNFSPSEFLTGVFISGNVLQSSISLTPSTSSLGDAA